MAVRCLHWQTLRHLVFTRPKQIENLWINCSPASKFMYANKCLVLSSHPNIRIGELPYDTSLLVGVSQHQRQDFHISTTYPVYAGVWNRTGWIEITIYGLSYTVYSFMVRFEKINVCFRSIWISASKVFVMISKHSSSLLQNRKWGNAHCKAWKWKKNSRSRLWRPLLLENEQVYSD